MVQTSQDEQEIHANTTHSLGAHNPG